jgi:hypothetical protein
MSAKRRASEQSREQAWLALAKHDVGSIGVDDRVGDPASDDPGAAS